MGRGEEAASPYGGGGKGRGRDGVHIIWDPPLPGHLLKISRVNYHGSGRQLASGGQQPAEGKSEVGATDYDSGNRGCRCLEIEPDILGGGPVGNSVQV